MCAAIISAAGTFQTFEEELTPELESSNIGVSSVQELAWNTMIHSERSCALTDHVPSRKVRLSPHADGMPGRLEDRSHGPRLPGCLNHPGLSIHIRRRRSPAALPLTAS